MRRVHAFMLRTIRGKLALGLAVVLGSISLFMFLYFPGRLEEQALQSMRERGREMAQLTAWTASAALYFEDPSGVEEAIAALEQVPSLTYVVVLDGGGAIVAARGVAPDPLVGIGNGEIVEIADAMHVRAPALHQGTPVGSVLVGFSLTGVDAAVQRSRTSVALVSVGVFVLGLVGVGLVGAVIAVPLQRLVTAAERIAGGDLSERVPVRAPDELGELGTIFNDMVERLQGAQQGLEQSNRELEARVRARTAELQHEIEVRRRAEAAAVESEARFRTVFESSALGIVLFGEDGRILTANGAAVEMLPAEPIELAGRHLCEVLDCPGSGELERYAAELTSGRRAGFETEARGRDRRGRWGWRRLVASSVRSGAGFDLGILLIEDTTERRSLEEKLGHAQKMEAVGRLAGGIAHDFNNLLTTINGMAEEAKLELTEDAPVAADLDEILKAGRRAAELTQQLLAFSRRQMLQPRVLDVNEVVQDTARLLRRLIGEDILLRLELGTALPVMADPGQLAQVLMNLATNARDAMPAGGELLIATDSVDLDEGRAARLGTDAAGPHLRLRVRDSGTGMDEATRRLVFEPFFTTKAVGKGTGLGLATVYGIVKQSGGAINVDSRPGSGTMFTILLPAVRATAPAEPALRDEPARVEGGTETVLLVEDEPSVRQFMARVLGRAGYRVLECGNGREAIDTALSADAPIHAVVTDVIMPEIGGIEMVRRIADHQPDLGVVFVSGYTRNEVLSDDGPMPPQHRFIAKPMPPGELIAAVRAVLDERAARRPAAAAGA